VLGAWFAASIPSVQADPAKPSSAKKKAPPRPIFSGWPVGEAKLRTKPLSRPSGKIEMYSLHEPKLLVSVNIYNSDGSYNDEAVEKLNHIWRCRRTETEKSIDPHLFDVLSHIYDHFNKPIALISGFRNQARTTSFHYVGSASDITIQGLADGQLKAFVESLDTGGMGIGIYPHAGFIHVDVRPEPSYRWIDNSPPGSSDMGQPKTRPRSPNS
jgi:uncharacterized protein YcbK (DUF882 family)